MPSARSDDSSGPDFDTAVFDDPPGFLPPDPVGKTVTFVREEPRKCCSVTQLVLELAPKHSLWAQELWNASIFLARRIDAGQLSVEGRRVLELGSGAGLPTLIAALNGAAVAVATDYATESDMTLLRPLQANASWLNEHGCGSCCEVTVLPHIWGEDTAPLLAVSSSYDDIFCADLLFNRHCHTQLLRSLHACLATGPDATVHVTFSHHDPLKAPLDLAFFKLAEQRFRVQHVCDFSFPRDVFIENDGLDDQRAVVHYYTLTLLMNV